MAVTIGEVVIGVIGVLGTGGGISTYFKYRTQKLKNKEKDDEMVGAIKEIRDSLKSTKESLETLSHTQQSISEVLVGVSAVMTSMQDQIDMMMRKEIHNSRAEIARVKDMAWWKQRHDFYHKMVTIIEGNNLINDLVTIEKVKGAIDESIRETDDWLGAFDVKGYLADTQRKIDFVCESEAPRVIYEIITKESNLADSEKMRINLDTYAKQVQTVVRKEFYCSQGRVKDDK
jgi:hypothetical protein